MEGLQGAFLYLIVFFAILYFLMIRPQQKQQKKRQELLSGLKENDKIITIGGLYGTITKIEDEVVHLQVAENVKLKFTKQGIGQVVE
ncbi:MAG: preprotein translocase subunit YajC [Bacillota bacterium]|nr:preprotein translocase subunit YajC [Bacillota bacterium]